MIRKEYDEAKMVEVTNRFYERTCTGYHVFCDDCGRELSDGEDMYEVLLYERWEDEEEGTRTLCKDCVKKATVAWIDREGELEMEIAHSTVDSKEFVGKTSVVNEDLHNLMAMTKGTKE